MRMALRIIALVVVVGAVTFWAVAGANRGWTKTQVPRKVLDPVTGLEGIQWQHKFIPGVDFLAVAVSGAGILGAISLFIRNKSK
jgi:hypothetical protein